MCVCVHGSGGAVGRGTEPQDGRFDSQRGPGKFSSDLILSAFSSPCSNVRPARRADSCISV